MTEFRLSDPDVMECPYAAYKGLFDADTRVVTDPDVGVVVTGYRELVELARNTATFSSSISEDGPTHMGVNTDPIQDDVQQILTRANKVVNALFTADPPAHTRHRKIINAAFNPRRVRALEPQIRATATELVDAFVDDGEVDFTAKFAIPLPLIVISDILGVARDDMMSFKHWGDEMISGNFDVLTHQRRREVATAVVDFHEYFTPKIEAARGGEVTGLFTALVNEEADGEPSLTTPELLVIISQLLLAGHETTTNLIGNAMVLLAERKDLRERLQQTPADIPRFLEEMLRWDPPIQCTLRRSLKDTDVHGIPVTKDGMVWPMWGAASRDPSVFPDPATFDMDRPNVRNHMGFGYGPHFCAGAELARLENRIAFEELLSRIKDFDIVADKSDLTHHPTFAQQGYKRVVLSFTRA